MSYSGSRPLRFLAPLLVLLLAPALWFAGTAPGRPLNFGLGYNNEPITSCTWPDSTVIRIYIAPHPTDSTRNDCVRQGIERWESLLAEQGITLSFFMNENQPADDPNSVSVTWVPDSTYGSDEGQGGPGITETNDGWIIDRGTMSIEDDNPCDEYLINLAAHEFGHVLGLGDEPTPPGDPRNLMDHDVPDSTIGFSSRDSAEWNSAYGFAEGPRAQGDLTGVAGGDHKPNQVTYTYTYTVSWASGPEIPAVEIFIGADPALVSVVSLPSGWELDWPPTYLDGKPTPAATASTRKLHFRATSSGFSSSRQTGTFVITSSWPPGSGWGQAMFDNDDDGWFDLVPLPVPTSPTTSLPPPDTPDAGFRLLPATPNPFARTTLIRFATDRAEPDCRVEIFTLSGRRVRDIVPPRGGTGVRTVAWNGRDDEGNPLPTGVYFYRITHGARALGGRLVLMR